MQRLSFALMTASLVLFVGLATEALSATGQAPVFRAGAAAIDITPREFPVIVSGSFLERTADSVKDPLHARCLVFDDGTIRIAIVVVDTLLMPRDLLDKAKEEASEKTGIPTDHILIAATHTHTAPSVVGALGTGVDDRYAAKLPGWIVEAIEEAVANLAPARCGWAVIDDHKHTNCRRWIRRPDRIGDDPFGENTIRAMMHPGYQNPDYVGPAGPDDPGLSVLAVQSPDGRPIALLANYSMHYFGAAAVSADYYGRFCEKIRKRIGDDQVQPHFVAMMSQGTSGDLHWMDYSQPRKVQDIDTYAEEVADVAYAAYRTIKYHAQVPLVMAETTLSIRRRTPTADRLAWARRIVDQMGDRRPKNHAEVYAWEQIYLHEDPVRELKLQAIRVGDLGMVAIPCEVYGITGLKIKARSPLVPTFNFELANGAEGYIPPPEQHVLGGYTTWPARSAALEVTAEPKIVEAVLSLLEKIAGRPRREVADPIGAYARAVLESKPIAFWRLGEFAGPKAVDVSGLGHDAVYEDGVAFYLEGPQSLSTSVASHVNRAAHFAGGRMRAVLDGLGSRYSVELWFWNGLPADARTVTGYFFSRGVDGVQGASGDHLGIGGSHERTGAVGRLFFYNGDTRAETLVGTNTIDLRSWNHVVLVRDGANVAVFLNGNVDPELVGQAGVGHPPGTDQIFVGGRSDDVFNLEGKIDDVAVYDRPLDSVEIGRHYAAARRGITTRQ